jgi:hypothetical protein
MNLQRLNILAFILLLPFCLSSGKEAMNTHKAVSSEVKQPRSVKPDWSAYEFLLGTWEGGGSGNPGEGYGRYSFEKDLQGQILIRKNLTEYQATKDRPAFSHSDLMIVYFSDSSSTSAIYFDNEGHVIHYSVFIAEQGTRAVFTSNPSTSAPRFRLTYDKATTDSLHITFEIAPPARPNDFAMYLKGSAHRATSNSARQLERKPE